MIAAAIKAAEAMPPAERADVFDGVAHVARRMDPEMALRAKDLARALRESEALQLHFRNLFSA